MILSYGDYILSVFLSRILCYYSALLTVSYQGLLTLNALEITVKLCSCMFFLLFF